tara:strand:- start:285 stop:401 length:117 start_codon:yes stop_codon:yes gene_type:complete
LHPGTRAVIIGKIIDPASIRDLDNLSMNDGKIITARDL